MLPEIMGINLTDDPYHPRWPDSPTTRQVARRKRRQRKHNRRAGHRKLRNLRWKLWKLNPHCHYCEKFLGFNDSTLDHKTAKANGGNDESNNLLLSCEKCNKAKGNKPYHEFRGIA